jgi:hypothetical protein
LPRPIFLDGMSDQRACGGTDGRADRRAAWSSTGKTADDCTSAGASCRTLPCWRVARVQSESGEQRAANKCENSFVHNHPSISPLNRASANMLRMSDSFSARDEIRVCGRAC